MAAVTGKTVPRVAVGQINSTSDHAGNLAQAADLCRAAEAAGAGLLCLPEAFSFIGASPQETISQAEALILDGTVSGGMIPKVETCIEAVQGGAEGAVIMDGRVPHSLLIELFTEHGMGTIITAG